jgi:hypothetical protein
MRQDDRYDYLRIVLEEGDDRHAIAGKWEFEGWTFVGYAHTPASLIFRKLKPVIEA